jgi:predicted O-methyltransferase YrrM
MIVTTGDAALTCSRMRLLLGRKELALLAALALGLMCGVLVALEPAVVGLGLLVVLCCVLLVAILLELYRRLLAQHELLLAEFKQAQAFTALVQLLQPRAPLPMLRNWAALPDLAMLLVGRVLLERPRTIVECGSGSSTILMGYVLQRLGAGRIVSLEHDEASKLKTEAALKEHGLESYATVVLAPLETIDVGREQFQFYDLSAVRELETIDLLFVDGPPSFMRPLARYPALPLMWGQLSPGATVILDDARRPRERETAGRWKSEFPQAAHEFVDTQKGAFVIKKPEKPS